ncbi:MAG: protein TolQ [Bradymonadia bacterium]
MDPIFVQLITAAPDGKEFSLMNLLAEATPVVKGVLVLLVLMSFVSWYIIAYKYIYLRRAKNESNQFLDIFWQSKRLDEIYQASQQLKHSPTSQVFKAGYVELSKLKSKDGTDTMGHQLGDMESVERALRRAQNAEEISLERLTPFLATTASAAPFIGLFGTVWGIMYAFLRIAEATDGNPTLDTVAPPIAEALIATAIGLVAAIPAVAAYNYFVNRIRVLTADMDNFSNDFLNIVKRHFFK